MSSGGCERCKIGSKIPGERYCASCRPKVLNGLYHRGYLDVPASGCEKPKALPSKPSYRGFGAFYRKRPGR